MFFQFFDLEVEIQSQDASSGQWYRNQLFSIQVRTDLYITCKENTPGRGHHNVSPVSLSATAERNYFVSATSNTHAITLAPPRFPLVPTTRTGELGEALFY
jgi:hypothetical protein